MKKRRRRQVSKPELLHGTINTNQFIFSFLQQRMKMFYINFEAPSAGHSLCDGNVSSLINPETQCGTKLHEHKTNTSAHLYCLHPVV
jgi:hypothetical protein